MINNFIFDLGGVLYALDRSRTERGLAALCSGDIKEVKLEYFFQGESDRTIFDQYEIGMLGSLEFREGLRAELKIEASDAEIDAAWNALLVGPIHENIEFVKRLKKKYRLVMLSNANELHTKHLMHTCPELFAPFEKLYFSQDLKMRKPDSQIFVHVLKDSGFEAEETMFIDDTLLNIEGAKGVGLRTFYVEDAKRLALDIETVLNDIS